MIAEDAGQSSDETSVNRGNNSRRSIDPRHSWRQQESVTSFLDETPSVSSRPSCSCSESVRDRSSDSCRSESTRLCPSLSTDDLKRGSSSSEILPISSAKKPRCKSLESGFDDDVRFFGNRDDTLSFASSSSDDSSSSSVNDDDDVCFGIIPLQLPIIGRSYCCGQFDTIKHTVADDRIGKIKDCSDTYSMSDGSDCTLQMAMGSDDPSGDVLGATTPVLLCVEVSPSVSIAANCVDGYLAVNTSMHESARIRRSEEEAFLDVIVTSLQQGSDNECASCDDNNSLYRLCLCGDTNLAGGTSKFLDRLTRRPCADDAGFGFPELWSTVGGNWRMQFSEESCCSECLPDPCLQLTDLSDGACTDRCSADLTVDGDVSSSELSGTREVKAEVKIHEEEETLHERGPEIQSAVREEVERSDGRTPSHASRAQALSYSLTQELPVAAIYDDEPFASSDCDLPPLKWCRSFQDDVPSDECAEYLTSPLPCKFSDYGPPPTCALDYDMCGGLSSFGRLLGSRARVCFEDDCGIRRNRTHATVCRSYHRAEQLCPSWGSCDFPLVPLAPVRCSRPLVPRVCPPPRPLSCCEPPKEKEVERGPILVDQSTQLSEDRVSTPPPRDALPSINYPVSTATQTPVPESDVTPKISEPKPIPQTAIVDIPENPKPKVVEEIEEIEEEEETEGICDPSELLANLPPCDPCSPCNPCNPCNPCCSFRVCRCDPCCRRRRRRLGSTSDPRCGTRCVVPSVGTSVTQIVSRWKRRRDRLQYDDRRHSPPPPLPPPPPPPPPRRGAVDTWIRSLNSKALDFDSRSYCPPPPSFCPPSPVDLCRSAVETNRTIYCPAAAAAAKRCSCDAFDNGDDDDDGSCCCWRSVDSTFENDDLFDSSAIFPTVTSVRFEAQIRSCRRRRGTRGGGSGHSERIDSMLRFLMQPAVSSGHGLDEGDRNDASRPSPLLLPPPPLPPPPLPPPPPPTLQKNVFPIDENLEKLYLEELMSTIRSTTERFARNLLAHGKV